MQKVTLEEMLAFRDKKVSKLEELRRQYPEKLIVTLGMNIPGPYKTGDKIFHAFLAGTKSIHTMLSEHKLPVLEEISVKEHAGYLEYYVVDAKEALTLKGYMIEIEEKHPYGRLFDIDVYREDGFGISRSEGGFPHRRCLLCENDAKECGRSRRHSLEELEHRVEEILCKAVTECPKEILK